MEAQREPGGGKREERELVAGRRPLEFGRDKSGVRRQNLADNALYVDCRRFYKALLPNYHSFNKRDFIAKR